VNRTSKENILSALRSKAEELLSIRSGVEQRTLPDSELAVLLNELEIHELEVDMQNDELRESYRATDMERSRFTGFFDSAPIGYFILDSSGTIREINRSGIELLDAGKDAILGKHLSYWIVPEAKEDFYVFINSMETVGNRRKYETLMRSSKGQMMHVQLGGIAMINPLTSTPEYYITLTDITESRNAAQILKETTERLNQTLKASVTGTWSIWPERQEVFFDEFSKNILSINPVSFDNTLDGLLALVVSEDQEKIRSVCDKSGVLREIDMEFRLKSDHGLPKIIMAKGREISNPGEGCYFTGILFDISERKRVLDIEEAAKRSQQRLLTQAALDAQEKERAKISAALHDSICQLLYGIRFNINHLKKANDAQLKTEMETITKLLDQTIREIRDISYELTPSVLKDFGFTAGIKEMCQRLSNNFFKIDNKIHRDADQLPTDVQLYAFRIIQELLNNSIKHSGATKVWVSVCTDGGQVNLTVCDNGKGIELNNEAHLRNGSGLRGIKNRVAMLNGTFRTYNNDGACFSISFDPLELKDY
jgi:PAS domain S-box-containing protein